MLYNKNLNIKKFISITIWKNFNTFYNFIENIICTPIEKIIFYIGKIIWIIWKFESKYYCLFRRFIENKIFTPIEKIIYFKRLEITYIFLLSLLGIFLPKIFSIFFYNFNLKSKQNKYLLFFIIFGLIIESIIYIKNKNRKSYIKDYIVPLYSRIFTILAYIWFFSEINRQFFPYIKTLKNIIGLKGNTLLTFYYKKYDLIPKKIKEFFNHITYYIFLYGIVRQKEHFSYFTRYHYGQAVILRGFSIFILHVLELIAELPIEPLILERFAIIIHLTYTTIILISLFYVLLGKESELLFLKEGTLYQVGIKNADNFLPR